MEQVLVMVEPDEVEEEGGDAEAAQRNLNACMHQFHSPKNINSQMRNVKVPGVRYPKIRICSQ